jgi:hypothetical protein
MDINKMLEELRTERAQVEEAILVLVRLTGVDVAGQTARATELHQPLRAHGSAQDFSNRPERAGRAKQNII